MPHDHRGLLEGLIGEGPPLISLVGVCLGLAGLFAILQSATGQFLPHDTAYLGMAAKDLCAINQCRVVHFMFHDRVSFGGSLIAIAVLYLWMAEFPLRAGEPWAWWTLFVSGVAGFGSFLTYLGYGYLDTWHGAATLLLLPCFVVGLWKSRRFARGASLASSDQVRRWKLSDWGDANWTSTAGVGRVLLVLAALGTIGAGFTIMLVGMTRVFVPTDLTFMGLDAAQLHAINPRLVPLIAHDRAGFGGGVATIGLLVLSAVCYAKPGRAFWQALLIGGIAGWAAAIAIHPIIGYTNALHLAPAVLGAIMYFAGLLLVRRTMYGQTARST